MQAQDSDPIEPIEPFDVIIVGGRPAGASLAARLGQRGLRVLVVDKATFPSQPEVPSCPVIYPSAIQLLDELGIDESTYEGSCTRLVTGFIEFEGHFRAQLVSPELYGRRYFYYVDRGGFDLALWDNLARYPSVTALSGVTVSDVVRAEDGRVTGVVASERGGPKVTYQARICVVGADGRHSRVARKVGARVIEDRSQQTSTVYSAEWEGVLPVTEDGSPALHVVSGGQGGTLMFFPLASGRTVVATQLRSDRVQLDGDAVGFYERRVRSFATGRRRLAEAQRVSGLIGVSRIANRYLDAGGAGWVLVGDALHHKDPLDGQGIYDALIGAKRLSEVLVAVHEGRTRWEEGLAVYRRQVDEETRPMFRSTMQRLKTELFEGPSPLFIRTMLRWMLNDPEYQRRYFMYLGRVLPPDRWMTPWLMVSAVARGMASDVGRALGFKSQAA
ncbi:NAD(P)/FAD-dependent oxidoreductase [Chondromyces crocatus]|uniref:FAD-binding domain-containing protein n=1 Tax=Chondromyces crocatus TaxID=52 RepID=A0A0K1EE20_CHOCO|nr:NAD(P)/FAD-dependent oxidoreductase [Chondromyces crocatus]AKT39111.1 uncharacterized protein CMC5_032580 [Chondromyces crocatus]